MAVSIAPFIAAHKTLADENSLSEEYLPESDGKPMAETERHRAEITTPLPRFRESFPHNPRVYVPATLSFYSLAATATSRGG